MSDSQSNKILAEVSAENFIGRTRETETLLRHAKGESKSRGLVLLSAPAGGASELLKQCYDQIFHAHGETIPFYFSVKKSGATAHDVAVRFMQTFIAQVVAFRHREPKIYDASPDISELAELAAPDDNFWINRLVAVCQNKKESNNFTNNNLNNDREFIRNCLSAPLRAAAYGANSFVMIDDLHEADSLCGEIDLAEELKEIFSRANVPFVLAGRRRFLLDAIRTGNSRLTDAEILPLEPLGFSDAGRLTENLAEKYAVKINEQTRDLIVRQFDGNLWFVKFLLQAASEKKTELDSFQKVERIYTDELFGGRIGKFYDSALMKIAPAVETQKNVVGLLFDALTAEPASRHLDDIFKSRKDDGFQTAEDFRQLIARLNWHELINLSSNLIEPTRENEVLGDYIKARFRLEIRAETRASVVGEMLSDFLGRAPQTMAKFYRKISSINLREILSAFDCQEIPAKLLDYSIYKIGDKDAGENETPENETEKIRLPQIVYAAHTAAFYPPFNQLTETTRSAVALGFEECDYTDAGETVWIAAEIDSKLEAAKETAEFWCDRLEMVALNCNFLKYRIWLVAPEGFGDEAVEILKQRNAFGSSRKQAEALAKFLKAENTTGEKPSAKNEYEIIVPMGEDTELIAANTIEEIARRHQFEPKAINQIKTALVEACINATEHSLSPDRKIYQRFLVEADKIVVTISNRGLRLTDKNLEEIKPEAGRRGWGLKLMRSLMDEVKIERVDDGTKISMIKYLRK